MGGMRSIELGQYCIHVRLPERYVVIELTRAPKIAYTRFGSTPEKLSFQTHRVLNLLAMLKRYMFVYCRVRVVDSKLAVLRNGQSDRTP
jgi:hypothetical protein